MGRSTETDAIKEKLRQKKKLERLKPEDFLSLGCTTLNLGCTGKRNAALAKGLYYLFVGDSNSGKTWLCLVAFAEANLNEHFKDYRFIYDATEHGALMDFEKFFGAETDQRIIPPYWNDDGSSGASRSISHFFRNVKENCRKGPCIYVLDSMDPLFSDSEAKELEKKNKKREKGEQTSGSMGMMRPKEINAGMREVCDILWRSKSILLIICQSRDTIGFGAKFNPKTRAGGHAMTFYATIEAWFSIKEKLTKRVLGKTRKVGIMSKVNIKRTRVTGGADTIYIPIYKSYGVDDLGACVDYLLDEGVWKKTKKKGDNEYADPKPWDKQKQDNNPTIEAPEFDFVGKKEELIKKIEALDQEEKLRKLVSRRWKEVEAASKLERKSRYA